MEGEGRGDEEDADENKTERSGMAQLETLGVRGICGDDVAQLVDELGSGLGHIGVVGSRYF